MNSNPKIAAPDQPRSQEQPRAIEAEILRLAGVCGPEKSICPSDVARALDPEWQKLSSAVRRAAIRLAEAGRIDILRKGKRVEPAGVKGVIRLRIGRAGDSAA